MGSESVVDVLSGEISDATLHKFSGLRVSKILIHPIKSCRGISVNSARYDPVGIEYDRRWCIIEAETKVVVTARKYSKTVLIVPQLKLEAASPHGGEIEVSFPEDSGCETFRVPLQPTAEILKNWELVENLTHFKSTIDGYIGQSTSTSSSSESPSSILSKYLGKPVYLMYKGPQPRACNPTPAFPDLQGTIAYQDGYPLLLLSEESVEEVERQVRKRVGVEGIEERWKYDQLVIERFRPNVIIKGGEPFTEDKLLEVKIGSSDRAPSISLVSHCTRCLLPNVDTETGERDKAVPFKVLMKFRTGIDLHQKMKPCLGRNGVPSASGVIMVGDEVKVQKVKIDH